MSQWKWDSYYLTGFMGIIIYGLLCLYSFQQIILSNWFKNQKIKYFNYKVSFHFIFCLCCLFEVIYYSSYMIKEKTCAWGYSFHMVSLFLNIVYYGMVVNLWGYTLDYFDYYRKFSLMSSILIVCNFILLVIGLYCLCEAGGFKKFQRVYSEVYVVLFITYSLSVALFTMILLIFGSNITYKLSQTYHSSYMPQLQTQSQTQTLSPSSSTTLPFSSTSTSTSPSPLPSTTSVYQQQQQQELLKKRLLVGRIIIVLIICLGCYILRVILISLNVYDFLYPNNHREYTEWPLSTWFFVSSVIPSVGPGIIFLYIMKTTRVANNSTTTTRSPTSSPQPVTSSALYNSNSTIPMPVHRKEESMVRISWYYEETTGENDRDERQTSITMRTRLLSSTDSANKAMMKTILVREGAMSLTSDIERY